MSDAMLLAGLPHSVLGRAAAAATQRMLCWYDYKLINYHTSCLSTTLLQIMHMTYYMHISLDLGGARRDFQNTRESEGKSLFGFSCLHACADRDAWRELFI